MDFIPTFRFVASLIMFGLCMYIYNPVITYLRAEFPTPASMILYANAMFAIWGALAGIMMLGSGIKLIMEMQRKTSEY